MTEGVDLLIVRRAALGRERRIVGAVWANRSNSRTEEAANARLIAAAPELLEALCRAAELTSHTDHRVNESDPSCGSCVIYAAIAKAEAK